MRMGSIMPHIGRKTLNEGWVNWHLSIGAAILFVILLRLMWRRLYPVAVASNMPAWELLVSRATLPPALRG
ncbi:MAG: hypothetical protein ABI963_03720 [Rhizomicrobium sp.]